ncbi:MAG: hypothetical protein U5K56_15635 [Halioglobus sp.]|nr:hypothetical protein [Halioglobus sp.]
MTEKASFYRSEGRAFVAEVEDGRTDRVYNGVERRRANRRAGADRRTEIRFDLNGDRRETRGRRREDNAPDFW